MRKSPFLPTALKTRAATSREVAFPNHASTESMAIPTIKANSIRYGTKWILQFTTKRFGAPSRRIARHADRVSTSCMDRLFLLGNYRKSKLNYNDTKYNMRNLVGALVCMYVVLFVAISQRKGGFRHSCCIGRAPASLLRGVACWGHRIKTKSHREKSQPKETANKLAHRGLPTQYGDL